MTQLGEFNSMTKAEREAWYKEHKCHPTDDGRAAHLKRVQLLKRANSLKPIKKILDIGCHDGFTTRWLLGFLWDEFEKLVAFDPSEHAIQCAKDQLATVTHPEKAEYLCGVFDDFKFDEDFDVVVAFELIEHLDPADATKLLKYMWNLLPIGGRAFLSTPDIDGRWGKTNPDPSHINLFDSDRLHSLIFKTLGVRPIIHGQDILLVSFEKRNYL